MKHLILLCTAVACATALAGCATNPAAVSDGQWLPLPGFAEGWAAPEGIKTYTPENLFNYIDGEADLYMPYGFKEARVAAYERAAEPSMRINADVYQMGSALDAFGVYSNYRSSTQQPVAVGAEGFASEQQLMFYQGEYFVRLYAATADASAQDALQQCAKAISMRLPKAARPPELDMLQVDGVTPGTERYLAKSVLGYAFFPRGMTADARVGEADARVFVVLYADAAAAKAGLDAYRAYLREKKLPLGTDADQAEGRAVTRDPLYKGLVVQQAGACLVGIAGLAEPDAGMPLVTQIAARASR